jgi:hypothetical protein
MINEAIKNSGLKKSEITAYVLKDCYGVSGRFAPRTKALKHELEILFDDNDYTVEKVWVNGLKEVVIESKLNLKNRKKTL